MSERAWRFYIDDMVLFTERIIEYTRDLDQEAFIADRLTYDATLRNLELIGEAATHVPEDVRQANAEVPWRMIIATRNRLIHSYLGIDDDVLWSIIKTDVPPLLTALGRLQEALP